MWSVLELELVERTGLAIELEQRKRNRCRRVAELALVVDSKRVDSVVAVDKQELAVAAGRQLEPRFVAADRRVELGFVAAAGRRRLVAVVVVVDKRVGLEFVGP